MRRTENAVGSACRLLEKCWHGETTRASQLDNVRAECLKCFTFLETVWLLVMTRWDKMLDGRFR